MSKLLCIYHGNCVDGFGAAWSVRHALGVDNVEFYAGVHNREPPDVAGRDVIMVDFSYKRPVLERMGMSANSILVLDHHKTARDDLKGLIDVPRTWDEWMLAVRDICEPKIAVLFDMERSGSGITWDFFHTTRRPKLIDHIEDRDLWRFNLAGTREINAALFSYPYDFNVWDELMEMHPIDLEHEGIPIIRKQNKDIAELLPLLTRYMMIDGKCVPVANMPYTLASDSANILAMKDGVEFAACYFDTDRHRCFSLRSGPKGADVGKIALKYGGGGHAHAAGFEVTRDHPLARE